MRRVTVSLEDRDHYALKLLSLKQGQSMITVVEDAIRRHLESQGAYKLCITSEPQE